MIVCDMCGKKKPVETIEFNDANPFIVRDHNDKYDLCEKCSKKLKRFIEFERARNNKH